MSDDLPKYPRDRYTILIICPLPVECTAMKAFFDEKHERHAMPRDDKNVYHPGRIRKHYVVIVTLATKGNLSVGAVATDARRTFQNLRFTLLVGVGAGAPRPDKQIEIGDVVLGTLVRHYDSKKHNADGGFVYTDHLNKPPVELLQIAGLVPEEEEAPTLVMGILQKKFPVTELRTPNIHCGIIASGDSVVKNSEVRDTISDTTGAICIEMESAGLSDRHNCFTIRGICDYADEGKIKKWQQSAARVAAAVATYILGELAPLESESTHQQSHYASHQTQYEINHDSNSRNRISPPMDTDRRNVALLQYPQHQRPLALEDTPNSGYSSWDTQSFYPSHQSISAESRDARDHNPTYPRPNESGSTSGMVGEVGSQLMDLD
ncbi:hypothetical protein TWF730_004416 [Orbilia blumenaviensis]|uniref:Nucleoside phosphorylase domain-containing protein n=1 Tax=Orbilia blumenaviensis TaxID=1796055 RepID=A0AAV9U257_9PEZI